MSTHNIYIPEEIRRVFADTSSYLELCILFCPRVPVILCLTRQLWKNTSKILENSTFKTGVTQIKINSSYESYSSCDRVTNAIFK